MITHKLLIKCETTGDIGTSEELAKKLKIDNPSRITQAVAKKLHLYGKFFTAIGEYKYVREYKLYKGNKLIDSGTAKELAEKYSVSYVVFCNYCRQDIKLYGKYSVKKGKMLELLERF